MNMNPHNSMDCHKHTHKYSTPQPVQSDQMKKIAKCFGITTDWLLFEEDERGPDERLKLQFEAVSKLEGKEREARGNGHCQCIAYA